MQRVDTSDELVVERQRRRANPEFVSLAHEVTHRAFDLDTTTGVEVLESYVVPYAETEK